MTHFARPFTPLGQAYSLQRMARRVTVTGLAWCAFGLWSCSQNGSAGSGKDGVSSVPETATSETTLSSPPHNLPQCLASFYVEQGFNCLNIVPQCWTRVSVSTQGVIVVTQPSNADGGPDLRWTGELDADDSTLVSELACDETFVSKLELRNTCGAPCSDFFVSIGGEKPSGSELTDPFAALCICDTPDDVYTSVFELLIEQFLPRYFPDVKHPLHF